MVSSPLSEEWKSLVMTDDGGGVWWWWYSFKGRGEGQPKKCFKHKGLEKTKAFGGSP